MSIDDRDVRHLERLAALRLDDAERERMGMHLQRILDYMRQLEAVEIEGVPPTYHVIEAQNVLREDLVAPSLPAEIVLQNAPDARGPFYAVPRFLGESEAAS